MKRHLKFTYKIAIVSVLLFSIFSLSFLTYFLTDQLAGIREKVLFFCCLTLLFALSCLYLIFYRINYFIRAIIKAIQRYQRGEEEQIHLPAFIPATNPLAQTINSLAKRICMQLEHIRQEHNEKEAILESLSEGALAVDQEMVIRYVNFIASKMIGLPRKQLVAKSLDDIILQKGLYFA